jgi:hypothetical protein
MGDGLVHTMTGDGDGVSEQRREEKRRGTT